MLKQVFLFFFFSKRNEPEQTGQLCYVNSFDCNFTLSFFEKNGCLLVKRHSNTHLCTWQRSVS